MTENFRTHTPENYNEQRTTSLGNAKMKSLTQQERLFLDHLDYEDTHAPYEKDVSSPACEWMKLHGLTQQDIWNVLMLRREERKDVMLPEKPAKPFAPAWATAEEAKRRNQVLGVSTRRLRENELEFLKAFMAEAGNLTEGPAHLAAKALGVDYGDVTQVFGIVLGAAEIKGSPEGNPSLPWATATEFMDRLEELRRAEPPV